MPFWALTRDFHIQYFSLTFRSATFNFNWSIYSFKSPTSFSADQPPFSWSHQAHSSACPTPQSTPSLHQHCPACPFDSFCTLFSTGRQAALCTGWVFSGQLTFTWWWIVTSYSLAITCQFIAEVAFILLAIIAILVSSFIKVLRIAFCLIHDIIATLCATLSICLKSPTRPHCVTSLHGQSPHVTSLSANSWTRSLLTV